MKVRTLLIDNEYKSLVNLRHKIEQFCPIIDIIGETHYPKISLELIEVLKPELIFLDVALKNMTQFNILSSIENQPFEIIYVTTFDHHYIEEFETGTIEKLLKPINNRDLQLSVNEIFQRIKEKKIDRVLGQHELNDLTKRKSNRIAVPTQDGIEFIKIDEIIHCQGVDGYTQIFSATGKMLLSSRSIGHFTKLLQKYGFQLVHKSHLINMDHICKYLNEGYLILNNDYKVPVSRNKRINFLNSFKHLSP